MSLHHQRTTVLDTAPPPAGVGTPRHRPSINITPPERVGRVVLGLGAIVAAAVLLTSAASVLAVVLEALLIAAGLDLAVTGGLGHCPLYARLGHVPRSLRRPT
ncbi:MAG: DUF2892 domain-containing protein [Acidimicrobiales bacterium]|nr:DUF2892 domain-containing protein [Acidimicrobiales bacterium]